MKEIRQEELDVDWIVFMCCATTAHGRHLYVSPYITGSSQCHLISVGVDS